MIRRPAPRPCVSCPYRRDVPSGVWDAEEYDKLPTFDGEPHEQAPGVFLCHQQDGRVCAGWAGCHDMEESLGLRMAASVGAIEPGEVDAVLDYATDVPLFATGAEAREHGLRELEVPGERARGLVDRLARKQARLDDEPERDPCCVSDAGCLAPAALRVGDRVVPGGGEGRTHDCPVCGDPVCDSCSNEAGECVYCTA